ncbi:Protein FAR-RED IMPAIRED RESPONSE 1 [Acorus gramineus]|uniref:Protein FAR-RED IMPAIRED RESPONSE 1 n=1 Tax=Acorus gramineus TaxID=55184 RepID=A0AAV9AF42_ACOGR|nr:Protein FAR-RED IMPAIRED RESPONSE 1 [Acorus gramineus]
MCFGTLGEAESFYVQYARVGGFGVRKSSTKYRKGSKEIYRRVIVCAKEGFKDTSQDNNKVRIRNRGHIRVGCKARIKFLKEDGKWKIDDFTEGHVHVLATPRKTHLLRSHREVTCAQKCLIDTFQDANVGPSQTMTILAMDSGGYDRVGCIERDIRNYQGRIHNEIREYDAQMFVDSFKEKAAINPSFYFAYELDEENRLTHCFWADGGARKAYAHFGDVVVFDTTYDTNQYSMIFAPFTGVNHHFQSISLGCGILKDEKIESFIWLFTKWQDAMANCPPNAIITDEDAAMGVAIARTLPQTHHRFCIWHIMKKLPEKVGALASRSEFLVSFKQCIYGSETPEEFEERWDKVINQFNIERNEWLSKQYGNRHKWIPTFLNDIFMAGMRSTQRSESQNSVFDKFLNKKHSLVEFAHHFERALERQRYNELVADHETLHNTPDLVTPYTVEVQMSKMYTKEIFHIFQKEVQACIQYGSMVKMLGPPEVYLVKRLGEANKMREVLYHPSNSNITCTCKKFETEGIPCAHMLVVLRNHFIDELPEYFVLQRWTITAKEKPVFSFNGVELRETQGTHLGIKNIELVRAFSRCLDNAPPEVYEKAKEFIYSLEKEKESRSACGSNDLTRWNAMSIPSTVEVRPPNISHTKGSGKRLKGGQEIAMEEKEKVRRTCSICGNKEKHNKRSCPLLKEM